MDGSSIINEDNTSILLQLPSLRDTDMSSQSPCPGRLPKVENKLGLNIELLLPFLQKYSNSELVLLRTKSFKIRLQKILSYKIFIDVS
jgi:hypothetical protein